MQALITLLVLPFILLNVLGWLVGFVWLVILGEWKEIGIGIAASIGMPFLFPIADLPSLGFIFVCSWLTERGLRVLALPFAFLASLWTNLLVMAWCSFIFFHYARVSGPENYIPLLLWGYSVAMAPLAYMAKFDADNPFTGFFLFIAQIVYVGLVVCFVIGTSIQAAAIFVLVMTLVMPSIALLMGVITLPRRTS
jgi:hypothetical protein